MGESIGFVGLDVHKATIAVCAAEAGRDGEVRFVGEIPNEPAALDELAARLGRGGRTPRFVYESRAVWVRGLSTLPPPRARLRRGGAEPHPA